MLFITIPFPDGNQLQLRNVEATQGTKNTLTLTLVSDAGDIISATNIKADDVFRALRVLGFRDYEQL